MNISRILSIVGLCLLVIGSGFASHGEVALVAQAAEAQIIAEGVIEPVRWGELRLTVGGEVTEILVDVGSQVSAGNLLLKLDDTDAALALQEAQAALEMARAKLALEKAKPQTEAVTAAEAELEAAKGKLWRAAALRDQLAQAVTDAETKGVQAQLEATQAEKRQVQFQLQLAEDDNDQERQTKLRDQIRALDLRIAAAQTRLEAIPTISAAQLRGANAGVLAAQAQVDVAQAQLDLLKAGPQPEKIAIAEATVQQAEASLAVAQDTLSRLTLTAPFDGTVTKVYAEVGDTIAPGQVVLVLAALDNLRVKTTDLTELDVVHVTEGQRVTVTVDAFPEQPLQGQVSQIKLQAVEYRGDVTYPVLIALASASGLDSASGLRWGMTVLVVFSS
jgi:HlyD family secretion protein